MGFLASRRWRIFLVAWLVYSVNFATNVVREHYPAFSIAEHGTFRVDEYQGFHSDIFVHRDGHSVIGNQVFVSVLAAIPLFVFDPVLDWLEAKSKEKIAREGVTNSEYRVPDKPNRVNFYRLVKERGLDLRFGAATFITTAFFMAPITAAFLVFFYGVLRWRGLDAGKATELAFLLGFGTPLFYRATVLGHNLFVMYPMFIAFVLMWRSNGDRIGVMSRGLIGLLTGVTIAVDYVGVIVIPLLLGYFLLSRTRKASWPVALKEAVVIAVGMLPPIGFLLFSQWAMYGNPFLPGQAWMPDQNQYVNVGARGWTLPDPQLFLMSLFDPTFGMYSWGPLLALSVIPAWRYPPESLLFPKFERRWLVVTWIVFLMFTCANQYSRLQFNSGFRYLAPLVPFLMFALADHWIRLKPTVRLIVGSLVVFHSWVLTAYRELSLVTSWKQLFTEGPQVAWYRVLGLTASPDNPWLGNWWVPTAILAVAAMVATGIWRYGARLEKLKESGSTYGLA
jgi:hypothetical protein